MFVYLSKKIAIPNNCRLSCVSWNSQEGWIACGGSDGLLKVLKLDADGAAQGADRWAPAATNLTMNQTLEGHQESVCVAAWNHHHQKLTSSDENGLIIVWMLHKGMWFEEMINNRNKSTVKDMKWTANGDKICIVYEDGAVIVGGVDGSRLWGKELTISLSLVEWSPDGRNILFCTPRGECFVYDSAGNAVSKLPIAVAAGAKGSTNIVGIDWHAQGGGASGGAEGSGGSPPGGREGGNEDASLVVALENGSLQFMRSERDDQPLLVNSQMRVNAIAWNPQGTTLAACGRVGVVGAPDAPMVHFFSPRGEHLRSLRVPGTGVSSLSWDGSGLRLALAVDSFVYFTNVRPDYMWRYFMNTLCYAYTKPDRTEHCVMFWDSRTNDRYVKYVRRLLAIDAAEDHCVLVSEADEPGQWLLIMCNAIGSPIESKYIHIEPKVVTMTAYHVVVSDGSLVYVWQYRSLRSSLTQLEAPSASGRKGGRERLFHISEGVTGDSVDAVRARHATRGAAEEASDPVTAMCGNRELLVLCFANGGAQCYDLPQLGLGPRHALGCCAQRVSLNADGSRLAVVDAQGTAHMYNRRPPKGPGGDDSEHSYSYDIASGELVGERMAFERRDVWDFCWSRDDPQLLALMSKTRMYTYRGLEPEEPVVSMGHICAFNELQIRAVLLDEIMKCPEDPSRDLVTWFETKSLRDTRALMVEAPMADAYQFVDDNAHPRLWRLLAEAALERLDFPIADKAFVRCGDYQGIQLVKRLHTLDDVDKQRAEVAKHFMRFDEAERLYHAMDRADLAIEMRMQLGDWFRVEKLVAAGGGDDAMLQTTWNRIGDYYAERRKWAKAVSYFAQAQNSEMLIECFCHLDDYAGLEKLIETLPEGSQLLCVIGERFSRVGLTECATRSYLKGGDVRAAVDSCIALNQWDQAVELAAEHNFPQIEGLLSKYAGHLLSQGRTLEAIELYRQSHRHMESARLLQGLAKEATERGAEPLRCKKLYVLAALEIEAFRQRTVGVAMVDASAAAATLDGLMQHEAAVVGGEVATQGAWRGAEAYHLWLLAHRQMYSGDAEAALQTALQLGDYEDILPARDLWSFVALAAVCCKHYGCASRAFIKLESLPGEAERVLEAARETALRVFTRFPPHDPKGSRLGLPPEGELQSSVCMISGRPVALGDATTCRTCKHVMLNAEMAGRVACPLCHASLYGAPSYLQQYMPRGGYSPTDTGLDAVDAGGLSPTFKPLLPT